MATPHVAGVIAHAVGQSPDLDATTIKQIIIDTQWTMGSPVTAEQRGPRHDRRAGLCARGHQRLRQRDRHGDRQRPADHGHRIRAGQPQSVTCDGNGHYTMGLPGDADYTLVLSRFGYITDTAEITLVGDGEVTEHEPGPGPFGHPLRNGV